MRSLIFALLMLPLSASAFCGFYVSGAGGKLFNDASMVVLLRDGTRTVLSMQNNYRGPAEDFAAFTQAATLTRLHLRYTKDSAPDDLVFKLGRAVHGGIPDVKGAMTAESNRFQGR